MTKTTEGLLSELNKTDEQNKTHEANIFEDKELENRNNMSFNNQQSGDHMQQQIQCVDGVKQGVNRGRLQQSYLEKKMVYALTEHSRLPTMVQVHKDIATKNTGIINKGSTLPETHHTSMSPIDYSVNQGLKVKTGHGDINMKEGPKEIGPSMAVVAVTSPTSKTSIGIGKGEVETVTNGARVKT